MSTPNTSLSRASSRAGTPISSPSRLAPPQVQPAPSVYSRVYSHGTTSTLSVPTSGHPSSELRVHSSSSSSLNVDSSVAGSMLIEDPDPDLEPADGEAESHNERHNSHAEDEESKQQLREQLRHTLSMREPSDVDDYPPRQYFVLTEAGKPVFVSQEQDESSESLTSTIGIMQALVSVYLDDGDKLRCINAGKTRISFLLRPPLYYVCVSSWGEPESVTRFHLEYLHLQILSVISAEQLRRMFERRANFDLRRLLSGAEPFMHSLLARLEWDLAMTTFSLHCLKVEPVLRKSIADVLVPTSKIKDILYVILIAQERVITLVRPKKHSIHPSDLHVLINTIHAPSIVNSSAAASWLPICLPKFNASAFVNAYVMFLHRENEPSISPRSSKSDSQSVSAHDDEQRPDNTSASTGAEVNVTRKLSPEVCLVSVSGSANFEAVRSWCDSIATRLKQDGLFRALVDAIDRGNTEYSVGDLGIPGLRHFVYKSRSHVQVTMPLYEDPYDKPNEKRRLITLYQTLYDAIHAKSGQASTLKLQYLRTEREGVMGWITQQYELYLALSPLLPKSAVMNAANAVARWVQKEERRLFLLDAPVF
ncbi:DUF254-domain-containing protein [Laetiporus sulphureus 93-53]|uniref:Vacuolar fusion protein MON1 n=1 Tax=Laetiporus sulphureus 93-53 TaxID=1314785 RepID=A0A165HR73_9APHY|nr:DUF254-domain-containing protein [Laetiporus sulphureus 93-53]KZT12073.1 DUF254-domain-containing protein [Laetiporus sulphureus 93-53]